MNEEICFFYSKPKEKKDDIIISPTVEEGMRILANYLIDKFMELKSKGLLKFTFKGTTVEIGGRTYNFKPVIPKPQK